MCRFWLLYLYLDLFQRYLCTYISLALCASLIGNLPFDWFFICLNIGPGPGPIRWLFQLH